jgi:hypothetical protein
LCARGQVAAADARSVRQPHGVRRVELGPGDGVRTVAFILLVLVPSSAVGQASGQGCESDAPPLELRAGVLLGWPDIERDSLPLGIRRELRVHQDVALGVPDYSLRLVDEGQRVTGEVLMYWPGIDYERVTGGDNDCQRRHIAEARALAQSALQSQLSYLRCGPVRVTPRVEGCLVSFTADPGWAGMMRRADSLRLWTLNPPRPKSLARGGLEIALDGIDVSVELRDPSGFREYSYNSPRVSGAPGEREVAALADLLQRALQEAHRQAGRN